MLQYTLITKKSTLTFSHSHLIYGASGYRIEMDQSKPKSTPMNGYEGLRSSTQNNTPNDRRLYQAMIGKIMYAIIYTRPDICFATAKLSQHMSNPNTNHEITVKHLMRYLQNTYRLCLQYGPINEHNNQEVIHVYSDSDYAADQDN